MRSWLSPTTVGRVRTPGKIRQYVLVRNFNKVRAFLVDDALQCRSREQIPMRKRHSVVGMERRARRLDVVDPAEPAHPFDARENTEHDEPHEATFPVGRL